ncbi:ORF6N domain-containing protein [Caproiciproducens sp. NJN-50]|uniref:ORF6N domain-containing protein n=1 Tax=Caproiciproducens sp. NJN-50 TaxID=2507162 RepID=UPI003FA4298A
MNRTDLTVKEYHGQRVVTFKDIDACHSKQEGAARKRFNENKQHFVKGTDFFEISRSDVGDDFGRTYGFSNKAPKGIIITESGYLMLVKSFTDDLAWAVQRQLVNTYFRKVPTADLKLQMQQERVHAMSMNAKTRALKVLMKTIGDKHLSAIAAQVFGLTTIEEVTGQKIGARPECGKLYSAQDIADEVGSNRITVGKKATAAGLKTDEYGITTLSKSEHGPKQVPTFMYNERGRAKVKELFSNHGNP